MQVPISSQIKGAWQVEAVSLDQDRKELARYFLNDYTGNMEHISGDSSNTAAAEATATVLLQARHLLNGRQLRADILKDIKERWSDEAEPPQEK